MADLIPKNFRTQFEQMGLPGVTALVKRGGNLPVHRYASIWVEEQGASKAAVEAEDHRGLTMRSVLAQESQADATRDAARYAKASAVAAWWAAGGAFVSTLIAFLVAARG